MSDAPEVNLQLGRRYRTRKGEEVEINGRSVDGAGYVSAPNWYCSWNKDGTCRQYPQNRLVAELGPSSTGVLMSENMPKEGDPVAAGAPGEPVVKVRPTKCEGATHYGVCPYNYHDPRACSYDPLPGLVSEAIGIPLADAVKDIGAVADKMRHHGDAEFQFCRMNDACWLMDGHAGDCHILAVKPVFTRLLAELRRPAPKARDVVVQEFEFEGRTCWASENPYRPCWIPTGRTHAFPDMPVDDKEPEA